VKVPEDDLSKKVSLGSFEPTASLVRLLRSGQQGHCGKGANGGSRNNLAVRAKNSDEEEWFMRVKILGVVILTALILAVAFSASAPAAPNTATANAAPVPAPAPEPAKAVPADHPEIHDALNSLRHAREHLEHAAHDFGGHRAEALRATDEAIRQLEICLKYDR
jgi:hypothetical protein